MFFYLWIHFFFWQTYRKDDIEEDEDIFTEQSASIQSHDAQRFIVHLMLLQKKKRTYVRTHVKLRIYKIGLNNFNSALSL